MEYAARAQCSIFERWQVENANQFHDEKKKKPLSIDRGFSINSLTMSYFHTGTRTIIGAEAFHCPVRDGKEWDHLAMVIRHNRTPPCYTEQGSQFVESNQIFDCAPIIH
jgi:hypothetical protein